MGLGFVFWGGVVVGRAGVVRVRKGYAAKRTWHKVAHVVAHGDEGGVRGGVGALVVRLVGRGGCEVS